MQQHILEYAKSRHTAKAYDPEKVIPDETINGLKELLRLSPSSVNIQAWHFVIAATDEGKQKVARAAEKLFPFNKPSILNASHIVVFASSVKASDDHLLAVLEQEEKDGRFDGDLEVRKTAMHNGRVGFLNLHREQFNDERHWLDKQLYLNVGHFLLGAAALGVDATPMEGIDFDVLDQEFGLKEKGYESRVVVTLGYRDPENDYNGTLPKSRLPFSYTMTDA